MEKTIKFHISKLDEGFILIDGTKSKGFENEHSLNSHITSRFNHLIGPFKKPENKVFTIEVTIEENPPVIEQG